MVKVKLEAAISSVLDTKAKKYAIKCHIETNHNYGGRHNETHQQIVID